MCYDEVVSEVQSGPPRDALTKASCDMNMLL